MESNAIRKHERGLIVDLHARIYWSLERVNSGACRKIMFMLRGAFPVDDRCWCSHHIGLIVVIAPSSMRTSAPLNSDIFPEVIADQIADH
jgi:hypothetical protein